MKQINTLLFYPKNLKSTDVYIAVNQSFFKDGYPIAADFNLKNAIRHAPDILDTCKFLLGKGVNKTYLPMSYCGGTLVVCLLPNKKPEVFSLEMLKQFIDRLLVDIEEHPENTYHLPLPLRWNKEIDESKVISLLAKYLPDSVTLYVQPK